MRRVRTSLEYLFCCFPNASIFLFGAALLLLSS